LTLKFQYNKTALQSLNKQLNVRQKALPTLKNKEAALRLEVKKARNRSVELDTLLNDKIESNSVSSGLWNEYIPELITIASVEADSKKIAGVKIPVFKHIEFNEKEFSLFNKPKWLTGGISFLREVALLVIEKEFFVRKTQLMDHARRKTTQKVNLYEKVQIPEYEDAIRKIKRFLEDEENLSKSAQKIVKRRQEKQMEENA